MDIQLPEVSGLEVTKWLKEDDDLRVIPVIAVTAFAMKGDEERIRRAAARLTSPSPYRCAHFFETIAPLHWTGQLGVQWAEFRQSRD